MKKVTFITVVALLAALFAAPAMAMTLTSSSFKDGGAIGMNQVCKGPDGTLYPEGKNMSPQLTISNMPVGTTHVAIVMEDTRVNSFHWAFTKMLNGAVAWSIPADADLNSEKEFEKTIAIFNNDYAYLADSKNGYTGPFPPKEGELSGTHTYTITAYALDSSEGLDSKKTLRENVNLIKKLAKDQASITGKFPYDEPEDPKASWKLDGTWNYTANVPKQTIEISGQSAEITAKEVGTIVAKMTTGEIEGKEYYDSITMSYNGTYSITANGKTQTGTESGENEPVEVQKVAYTPGEAITYSKPFEIEGIKFTERLECYQTEENKIEGKLYLYQGNTLIATGDVTATRPTGGSSSSSGGCNAGFGALALLMTLPMFYRKKK